MGQFIRKNQQSQCICNTLGLGFGCKYFMDIKQTKEATLEGPIQATSDF